MSALTIAVAITAGEACISHMGTAAKKSVVRVSPRTRLNDIRHARVWEHTDIPSMDIRTGPVGPGAFAPGATVACRYLKKEMAGNSPKFTCVIPPEDEVKVKFGRDNGEVYAEVAATRLFWALGFPVDRMYPVRVLCEGCPPGPEAVQDARGPALMFDPASIERKFTGRALETEPESGWSWADLDKVDEAAGGAPRAQRDALKLLAVFIQHTDSKPAQQRLVCVDDKPESDEGVCAHTVMMSTISGRPSADRTSSTAIGSAASTSKGGPARTCGPARAIALPASVICRRRRAGRSTTRGSARRDGDSCLTC